MKGTLTVLCAGLAFSWVAVAGAQTSGYGSGQSTSSESAKHSSKTSREVTLTGCLEQGSTPNTFVLRNATREEGSSSSSSQGASGSGSAVSGGSTQGTSGTTEQQSGSSSSSMSGERSPMDFQLVAGRGKDLKKYVGQRVEVKGVVEPMEEPGEHSGMSGSEGTTGSSGSGMSGSSGSTGSQSGSGSSAGSGQSSGSMSGSESGQGSSAGVVTHRVKVNSIKQLGSSCQ